MYVSINILALDIPLVHRVPKQLFAKVFGKAHSFRSISTPQAPEPRWVETELSVATPHRNGPEKRPEKRNHPHKY